MMGGLGCNGMLLQTIPEERGKSAVWGLAPSDDDETSSGEDTSDCESLTNFGYENIECILDELNVSNDVKEMLEDINVSIQQQQKKSSSKSPKVQILTLG